MRAKRKIDIEVNKYKKKRKNNPAAGLVSEETEPLEVVKKKKYSYDPHLSPELQWAGKKEHTSFAVPTVSLHTHEKIDSRAIIERVRKTNTVNYVQQSLFKDEQTIPTKYDIDFYKHDKNWSNRLIAGDSLLVMNSLLEKEGMGGKVQCVYIDPPYGIKYGSNFQPFTNKRDVKDGKDEDLTAEPEMLKAFRDTWELGIHSWLAYLRDRLLLARELLTDSGSCFVQISDENVHLVRNIMDEIFVRDNFISEIVFRKKQMPLGAKYIERSSDFILWYAKNKKATKYRPLYIKKNVEGNSIWNWVELADGTRRKLKKEEINNHALIPKGAKIFQSKFLMESKNAVGNFQYDVSFQNKVYNPKNFGKGWVTHEVGMKNLLKNNRVILRGNTLGYVLYHDDYPCTSLMNVWHDTGSPSDMRYVVQTNPQVIQRCILMTTDPGDLVLDPTCGSGTTAYVAEQWGRRWITCDTSRVAITLAKQRLMTAVFDYYKLENPHEGVSSGFQYEKVPHITLGSIANNEPPKEETLYDKPLKDSKKVRVTAPFTVEAVPSQSVQHLSQENGVLRNYDWLDEVKKNGVRGKRGITADMGFARLEVVRGFKYLHAEGETTNPRRVVMSFGSEYAPLDKRQVEVALEEAKNLCPDVLIFAAFHFDAEAAKLIAASGNGKMKVAQVQMNMDLQTKDLKKKTSSNESFWLIGQPDVEVEKSKDNKYVVKVKGWDYYDPTSGQIKSGGQNKVAMWLLDTDYDGKAVFPKQVFFPMAGKKDGWTKLAKNLKTEIDEGLVEQYRGTESLPFEAGDNKKIAVKIIDDRGIESLKITDLSKLSNISINKKAA